MDQIIPPKLPELELEALRQIAAHPAPCHIPYRVQSRLKDIGYAKEVLGGLVLTDDGLQRIAIDRERVTTGWSYDFVEVQRAASKLRLMTLIDELTALERRQISRSHSTPATQCRSNPVSGRRLPKTGTT